MRKQLLPLFFMHVPKCAGTSVYSLISASFKEGDICPAPPHGGWTWRAREVPNYLLYWGHFTHDFLDEMDAGGTRLIMLRHPVSRVVSLYDYWRSYRWEYIRSALPALNGPSIAKAGNLAGFLATTSGFAADIYNSTARQLLGSRFGSLEADENAAIAESLSALRSFAWIGIAELFEPSVAALSKLLGIRLPRSMPKERSTYDVKPGDPQVEPVEKTDPSEAERDRILAGNHIDLAIYREGRAMLEERLRGAARSKLSLPARKSRA